MSRRVANVLFGCGCCDIRGRAHNTTPDSAKGYGESRGGVPFAGFAKGTGFAVPTDENRLERRYGSGHLHFITCSCFRRMPLLASPRARDKFLKILGEVCDRYDFGLFGYVVMPEHIHLLISEPNIGNPSEVMAVLKQRVSRALRGKKRKPQRGQMQFWDEPMLGRYARFWQPFLRFQRLERAQAE